MERIEVSEFEDSKQHQPGRDLYDTAVKPEDKVLQPEVACSCPGCFSFDF